MKIETKQDYLALSNMLLTTTLLSNDFNDDLDRDSSKIVDFIGKVFDYSEKDIYLCSKLIKDDLTIISKNEDVDAYQGDKDRELVSDYEDLIYLKSEAILKINNIFNQYAKSNFEESYFDYHSFRSYFPVIRFNELKKASAKGNVDINRTVAILLALGIGCEKNINSAIYRFKQCAYWGDTSSLFYLAYLYKEVGDSENHELFYNLTKLFEYIYDGKTMLPKEVEQDLNKKIIDEFALISSIVLDIRKTCNLYDINYSFVEVMLMDSLSYSKKMSFINNYKTEEWRDASNSSHNPRGTLFFKSKEGRNHE